MVNEKKLTLVNEKNYLNVIESDLLCAFELDNNKYVIYSKNEKDFNGKVIVYFGRVEIKEGKQYIVNVNDNEYFKIKDVIKEMINYNGEEYNV